MRCVATDCCGVDSCFEESMCVLEKDEKGGRRLQLHVGTVCAGQAKLLGEDGFPIGLLERGFTIDVAKGESSVEQDRKRILNSLAGRRPSELDTLEPPAHHEHYTEVGVWMIV